MRRRFANGLGEMARSLCLTGRQRQADLRLRLHSETLKSREGKFCCVENKYSQ
ncbi:rCG57564 [Rattus norvegicus]|uniref:RCG57564 n=1 Tax=Rattus norvegicus TaxID=10116 RepID=A6JHV4_RAT|nr:rCG57564 [Rattus norvegicus]